MNIGEIGSFPICQHTAPYQEQECDHPGPRRTSFPIYGLRALIWVHYPGSDASQQSPLRFSVVFPHPPATSTRWMRSSLPGKPNWSTHGQRRPSDMGESVRHRHGSPPPLGVFTRRKALCKPFAGLNDKSISPPMTTMTSRMQFMCSAKLLKILVRNHCLGLRWNFS